MGENNDFFSVKVNQIAFDKFLEAQVKAMLLDSNVSKIFYSLEDLSWITSFSIGHIKNTFFDDPRFKKIRYKVGRK